MGKIGIGIIAYCYVAMRSIDFIEAILSYQKLALNPGIQMM